MPSDPPIITASKGDLYCRPAGWLDVVKFILLNYGLHALTVISEPGSGLLETTFNICLALLRPYAGMSMALLIVFRGARFQKTPLKQAHRARALCMAIRKEAVDKRYVRVPLDP